MKRLQSRTICFDEVTIVDVHWTGHCWFLFHLMGFCAGLGWTKKTNIGVAPKILIPLWRSSIRSSFLVKSINLANFSSTLLLKRESFNFLKPTWIMGSCAFSDQRWKFFMRLLWIGIFERFLLWCFLADLWIQLQLQVITKKTHRFTYS